MHIFDSEPDGHSVHLTTSVLLLHLKHIVFLLTGHQILEQRTAEQICQQMQL